MITNMLPTSEKRVLKEFIQSLQNRVFVAVSLAVVRSKPAHLTGEEHAERIQQLVYDNWVKDSYVSFFENKIIDFQQEKLFKEINELLLLKKHTNTPLTPKEDVNLLPKLKKDATLLLNTLDESFPIDCSEEDTLDKSIPGVYSEDTLNESIPGVCLGEDIKDELVYGMYSEDTQNESYSDECSEEDMQEELMSVDSEENTRDELIPDVCSEEYLCGEIDSDFDDSELFENNISFIQAMVKLKFPVFSSGYVTMDIIHNFLDEFYKSKDLHKYSINKELSNYDGSIFGKPSTCNIAELNVDQIRIIINSSRTEYLIKKCLASVIHFAYKNIHNNSDAIFHSWNGSVMEYLCSVLEEISFHPVCTDYLSKLVLKFFDGIWSSEDSSKHLLWEHQQHILSVFCVNSHVCERVIDFIIVKFDVLITLINKIQIGMFEHFVGIHLIEKLPHFTRFLCMVIKKHQFYKSADIDHTENQIKYNNSVKVTDLWKLKWRENNENEFDKRTKKIQDLIKRWEDICEELIIKSATNFPLISVHIWDVLTSLQVWNSEIKQS